MSTLAMILTLSAINVSLIWLLLAAPIGLRTVTIRRVMPIKPSGLWALIGPGAALERWNPEIAGSRWSHDGPLTLELTYRQPDGEGRPSRRAFAVRMKEEDDARLLETEVAEDTVLDLGVWCDYRERWRLAPTEAGSVLEASRTDRYRGLAIFLWRYATLRAELASLERHALQKPPARHSGLHYVLGQCALAILSTLALWPFLGADLNGLMISTFLTLVIVLHEMGHMLAYRAFGHPRASMIFIPLLGGVAIGGRPYRSRFEMATCAMMGAGVSAFVAPILITADETLRLQGQAAWATGPLLVFLLILGAFNLLNLMPVHRFDGGQVLRQVFRTGPSLGIASFLSAGAILWTGYAVGIPPLGLIAGLAVFVLLSLIRTGKAKMRHTLPEMNGGEKLMVALGYYAALSLHALAILHAGTRLFPG